MSLMHQIRRLRRAQEGAILVLWGVSFAVILGMIALSFDLGRVNVTQTELQAYADSAALAAAGELDGGSDAITRATNAAANLITDRQTFGSGGPVLSGAGDFTISFYSDLPASDTAAMTAVTTDPSAARYVRVVVNTESVPLTFGAAFNALRGDAERARDVNASAVAGFTQMACDVTPLMFCIPSPGFTAEANIGRMILLRSGGSGAGWGPGDFGFLDPSSVPVDPGGPCGGLSGVQRDACLIGATGAITQCFAQNGVNTQPGQRVGIEDAIFNVRFDIYKAIMNGRRNNPIYAPAPNVIKGIVPNGGGNCIGGNPQPAPDTLGLPRDDCFYDASCTRFGNGVWSRRADYVNMNYGGVDPHPGETTRWGYYQAEIAANGGVSSTSRILNAPRRETGRRQCSNQQDPSAYRRVVVAAAIDCTANPINGAEVGVPVEEFVELFLTEPVGTDAGSPPTLDLWVEVVGSAGNGGSGAGLFRDFVQLYR